MLPRWRSEVVAFRIVLKCRTFLLDLGCIQPLFTCSQDLPLGIAS
jgi:hypothetical protein